MLSVNGQRTLLLASSVILAGCHESDSPPAFDPIEIRNLGIDAEHVVPGFSFLALLVTEASQGADLNGDGDAFDRVVHVYDPVTRKIENLGFAAVSLHAAADSAVFVVIEASQGATDLNGDGDTTDRVLFVHSVDTGISTNLGVAVRDDVLVAGCDVAFRVDEAMNGAVDLNGDGDAGDSVMHVLDVSSLTVTNLGIEALSGFGMAGSRLAFLAPETGQATPQDLNGDGDFLDRVLFVHDLWTGSTTSSGLAGVRHGQRTRTRRSRRPGLDHRFRRAGGGSGEHRPERRRRRPRSSPVRLAPADRDDGEHRVGGGPHRLLPRSRVRGGSRLRGRPGLSGPERRRRRPGRGPAPLRTPFDRDEPRVGGPVGRFVRPFPRLRRRGGLPGRGAT